MGFLPILEFLLLPKTNIAREKSGWETIFFWEGLFSRVMLVSGKAVKFPHSKPTFGKQRTTKHQLPTMDFTKVAINDLYWTVTVDQGRDVL